MFRFDVDPKPLQLHMVLTAPLLLLTQELNGSCCIICNSSDILNSRVMCWRKSKIGKICTYPKAKFPIALKHQPKNSPINFVHPIKDNSLVGNVDFQFVVVNVRSVVNTAAISFVINDFSPSFAVGLRT